MTSLPLLLAAVKGWVLAMLGSEDPARGSDPGLSAAFDLGSGRAATLSPGRLRRDGVPFW
jgi:hypothetical protein